MSVSKLTIEGIISTNIISPIYFVIDFSLRSLNFIDYFHFIITMNYIILNICYMHNTKIKKNKIF